MAQPCSSSNLSPLVTFIFQIFCYLLEESVQRPLKSLAPPPSRFRLPPRASLLLRAAFVLSRGYQHPLVPRARQ